MAQEKMDWMFGIKVMNKIKPLTAFENRIRVNLPEAWGNSYFAPFRNANGRRTRSGSSEANPKASFDEFCSVPIRFRMIGEKPGNSGFKSSWYVQNTLHFWIMNTNLQGVDV